METSFTWLMTLFLAVVATVAQTTLPTLEPPKTLSSVLAPIHRTVSVFDKFEAGTTSLVELVLMIENDICEGVCKRKGTYPHNHDIIPWPMCRTCHCDELCRVYQDCCPDVLLEHNVTYEGERYATCLKAKPFPVDTREYTFYEAYNFFAKCPMDPPVVTEKSYIGDITLVSKMMDLTSDNDVIKCEYPDLTNFDDAFPVSSATTGISYGNIHCARCHNDTSDIRRWRPTIDCKTSALKLLSSSHSKTDIFQTLMTPEGVNATGCELMYTTPRDQNYARHCTVIEDPIISECNVSGNVQYYDKRFDEACAMYTSVFSNKYKNMFCYLCNMELGLSYEGLQQMVHFGYPNNAARLSFSALLDFDDEVSSEAETSVESGQLSANCSQSQFYDPTLCECRTPSCSQGKFLTQLGSCESLITSNILGYHVCAQLRLETTAPVTEEDVRAFLGNLQSAYRSVNTATLQHVDVVKQWCPGDQAILFESEGHFALDGTLEDIEKAINETYSYIRETVTDHVLQTGVISSSSIYFTSECSINSGEIYYPCASNHSIVFGALGRFYPTWQFDADKLTFLTFSFTSKCPFVQIPLSNSSIQEIGDRYVYKKSKNSIHKSKVDKIDNSEIRICVSDYLQLTTTDLYVCKIRVNDFDTWTISGLVSIICTCISLLCLLLTFLIYVLLAPLRSGGGKNIMILTVTLFIAQAFYEFAIEQFDNQIACKAFGIVIHYSWLAAVFSMNACTVERFYKLCFPLASRVFFMSKKPFVFATVYTFTCPLIIVGINVIVNFLTRDNIGYGSATLCYINTSISRVVTFAVPVAIVVVVNICLLLVTIWNLRKKSEVNSKSTSQLKLGLVACVRLSTVTGLTWLLTFLYEFIPYDALGYIFTALIGLQGVVFFFSMALNKRVFGLLSEFFGVRRPGQKYSSSGDQHSPKGKGGTKDISSGKNSHTTVTKTTSGSSGGNGSPTHTGS